MKLIIQIPCLNEAETLPLAPANQARRPAAPRRPAKAAVR